MKMPWHISSIVIAFWSAATLAGYERGSDIYDGLKRLDMEPPPQISILALGYLMGIADQLETEGKICYSQNTTVSQIAKASENYLGLHPEGWNYQASVAVAAALISSWPCSPR